MKLRWRQHEFLLITMLAIILLGGYIWIMTGANHNKLEAAWASPFIEANVPFNLYRNVLIPDLSAGLLIYLSYCCFYFYILPPLQPGKENKKRHWLRATLKTGCVILLLCAGFVVISYYKEQWQYKYEGFSFFPSFGHHLKPSIDSAGIIIAVTGACLLYILYVLIREFITYLMERPGGNRPYRLLIANSISLFLVVYTCIAFFAAVFHLVHDGHVIAFYYTFVLPAFAVFMTNMYWLFPAKGLHAFTSRWFLQHLLLSTSLCSLLSLLSPFNVQPGLTFFAFWFFLAFVVTPITWLVYQQQKDKIIELRGVQQALVQSTTHLQLLQSQINPHFLFNTLNTLYGTALEENADRTGAGIQRLGDMMRFMLYENTLDFIDMAREINYLKNYIALQKLRIAPSAGVVIDDQVNEQNCHHRIAPMLLIPFVENAFKHGINLDSNSWIKISLDCTVTTIQFNVSNSVHPVMNADPEKEHGGIGNKNVTERLKLIYPGKHSLIISNDAKEFTVQLVLFV